MTVLLRVVCTLSLIVGWTSPQAGTFVQFRTVLGDVEVELFDEEKPATVRNFIRYVESGVYHDMFLHRWVPGFVIQGGGYFTENRGTTNAGINGVPTFGQIQNEYSNGRTYSNVYGTIAMARVGGQTNSATSQWFFNLADNSRLDGVDGGFTVFGRVLSGTNVLNRFNNPSPTNGLYIASAGFLTELPVKSNRPTLEDLIYPDISLLKVEVARNGAGGAEISWNSVSNRVNHVEITREFPPVWTPLTSTNGNGARMSIIDSSAPVGGFYRVRVEY
jgi:cyclophilin family peptidyl-prolyl cis-trans isomerase